MWIGEPPTGYSSDASVEAAGRENGGTDGRASGTIFDDVFRTMVEKMPELVADCIHAVFGRGDPENDAGGELHQIRNEHMDPFGKIITDSVFEIAGDFYHMECQSTADDVTAL